MHSLPALFHSPSACLASILNAGLMATALIAPAERASAQSVDIEAIFNCNADGPLGEQTPDQCVASRMVLLTNCTSCHTFVPVVKAQKSPDAWGSLMQVHRARVEGVSDEEYAELGRFLVAHFNETNPVPALPPELEALGSNQPE